MCLIPHFSRLLSILFFNTSLSSGGVFSKRQCIHNLDHGFSFQNPCSSCSVSSLLQLVQYILYVMPPKRTKQMQFREESQPMILHPTFVLSSNLPDIYFISSNIKNIVGRTPKLNLYLFDTIFQKND